MVAATYELMVDWNNNGTFGDANEDITADMLRAEWVLGRDFASMLTGRARGTRLLVTLDNDTIDGKYSSFNSASLIFGNILPGRKVRLRATDASGTVTIWQGFLDRINPQVSLGAPKTALLEAIGPLTFIGQPWHEIFLPMRTNDLTGALIGAILDAVSWPAGDRDVDPGKSTIRRAVFGTHQNKVPALDAMHRVEETENGFLHESVDGKVIFEDRDRRLKAPYITSQVTLSDQPGAGEIVYSAISQLDPLKQIFNVFQTTIQQYNVGAVAVLWTLPETGADSPPIAPGETRAFVGIFLVDEDTNMGVDAWTTPVATTDYVANSAADGSGSNLTSSIALGTVTKLGTRMVIPLTNNHATLTAYMTLLQARGTPITRRNPVLVYAEDIPSQVLYNRRIWTVPAEMVRDTLEGKDHVDWLLSIYKDPRPTLTVMINGNRDATHLSHVLRRRVSDRIIIEAESSRTGLGINQTFFIESQRHVLIPGRFHQVIWECSGLPDTFPFWTVGTGDLGTTTALHY